MGSPENCIHVGTHATPADVLRQGLAPLATDILGRNRHILLVPVIAAYQLQVYA